MGENQYAWTSFFKKLWEFLSFFISFFRGKKAIEDAEQKAKLDKATQEVKNGYDKIDKEKNEGDLNKRLNNMF